MSESELNNGYRFDRVIMDESDVLESDFLPAVVHLSGGQLNILRNLMEYATRRTSFYSSLSTDYYTTPDDDDWDEISDIVADLELRLMGNDNVIFGYGVALQVDLGGTLPANENWIKESAAVPAGQIWVIQAMSLRNDTGSRGLSYLAATTSAGRLDLQSEATPSLFIPLVWQGAVVLREGNKVRVEMLGCLSGDEIVAQATGYKMFVPE